MTIDVETAPESDPPSPGGKPDHPDGTAVSPGGDGAGTDQAGAADPTDPADPVMSPDAAATPRWYLVGLALTALAALLVRVVNVLVVRPTCDVDMVAVIESKTPYKRAGEAGGCFEIWGDTVYSFIQGRMISRGHWFVDSFRWFTSGGTVFRPSSGDPPLFALFLGLLAKLGLTSGTAQRLVLALVGTAGVVLLATLAARLAGRRVGLIAGGIAAVYPMLWINDGMLLSESLYVPLILVAMHAAYSFWERPGYRTALAFGLGMALAALTRAEALILLGVMPLPLLWGLRSLGWRPLLRYGAVAIGSGCLLIAPWIGFNVTRFHNPAYMTSATGAVLSSANCDTTYYTESIGYYGNCFDEYVAQGRMLGKLPTCTQEVVDAVRADYKSPLAGQCWPNNPEFDETDRDKFSYELGMEYMLSHKSRLPVVMLARVGRMWDLYTPDLGRDDEPFGQNVRFNWQVEGRGKLESRTGVVAFWLLLPLAVIGSISLWKRRVPISPLLSMTIVITVTAALTFGITRYRVPVDVVVVILGAVGIDALFRHGRPASDGPLLTRRRGNLAGEGLTVGEPAGEHAGEPAGAAEALARVVPAVPPAADAADRSDAGGPAEKGPEA